MKKYIAYIRVSTKKQGRSGLGLEAQEAIITYFAGGEDNIVEWYKDVHSGKNLDVLPSLNKAKERAKKEGYILIIAKTDRLRNTQQALDLVDEMTPENIVFCDLPNADKFTLTIFFALAERERLITSIRTKAALDARKRRGERVGNPNWDEALTRDAREQGAEANRQKAEDNPANKMAKAFAVNLRKEGYTFYKITKRLNEAGFKTPTGCKWHSASVSRLVSRN